jgi:hypothetical protein
MKKLSKSFVSLVLLALVSIAHATKPIDSTTPVVTLNPLECAVWTGAGAGYENDGIPATVTVKVERLLEAYLKNGNSLDEALALIVSGCKAERILNNA